jgi:plastocyanin
MKRYLRIRLLAIFLACTAAIAGAAAFRCARGQEKAATVNIGIDNFSFTPREITVAKGTVVTWTNRDDVPHTVVSTEQKFRSKALDTDDQFSFTFTEAGTYVYFCSVHPMMTGKIIVK